MKKTRQFSKKIVITVAILAVFVTQTYAAEPENKSDISGDIFERGGGHVHGFLSVAELYSDNIFNTHADKESDSVTRLTPGVWFMLPGGKERLPETATASVTPGGAVISGLGSDSFRKFRAYAFYSPEFEFFSNNSDQNSERHLAEGLIEYKFTGGLSLGILEQLHFSQDERGSGLTVFTTELEKYMSNLVRVFAAYDWSSKLRMEAKYANFFLDYSADRNFFRDRDDAVYSGALFFNISSKTAFFGEYEIMKIAYDRNGDLDGDEKHYFGGVRWRMTGKSSGMIKGGWGEKIFDQGGLTPEKTLIFQAQVDHRFTGKSGITLTASRRTNESNLTTSDYSISESIRIGYLQKINDKLSTSFHASYTRDSYNGDLILFDISKERKDELYGFTAGLGYAVRKWLTAGMEYRYSQRDSNFQEFAFSTNEVLFKINCSL
jgi:polysaccharide biosynthesis protein VpsM